MSDIPKPVKTLKPLIEGIRNGHLVLLGMTKYGKTTLAKHLLMQSDLFDKRKNPVGIILDTKHDDSLLECGYFCDTLTELAYHIDMKAPRIVFRPPGTSARKNVLTEIIQMVFHYRSLKSHANVPFAIFIDELQLYAGKQEKHEGLEMLSTTGAGKDIHGIFMAQRMQDIHEQSLSQCDTMVCFFMKEQSSYLKRRGMDELIDWLRFLKLNPFFFAFETRGVWQLHEPVPFDDGSEGEATSEYSIDSSDDMYFPG
jgi:hypothetical protein